MDNVLSSIKRETYRQIPHAYVTQESEGWVFGGEGSGGNNNYPTSGSSCPAINNDNLSKWWATQKQTTETIEKVIETY